MPCSSSRRVTLLGYAVSKKWNTFDTPVAIAMVLQAVEKLNLEPAVDETRRWEYLMKMVRQHCHAFDTRTTCNVLYTITRLIARTFRPSQDLKVPDGVKETTLELQRRLQDDVVGLSVSQALMLAESQSALQRLHLQLDEVMDMNLERAPMLASHSSTTDQFAALIRIIASEEAEWSNTDVCADLFANVRRHFSSQPQSADTRFRKACDANDALALVDALTLRSLENGATVVTKAVPAPLESMLSFFYDQAISRHMELSSAQACAWLSRLVGEQIAFESKTEFFLGRARRRPGTAAAGKSSRLTHASSSKLLTLLLRKFAKPGFVGGLSSTALRTAVMTLNQMWTPPVSEETQIGSVAGLVASEVQSFVSHREAHWGTDFSSSCNALATLLQELERRAARDWPVLATSVASDSSLVVEATKFVDCVVALPLPLLHKGVVDTLPAESGQYVARVLESARGVLGRLFLSQSCAGSPSSACLFDALDSRCQQSVAIAVSVVTPEVAALASVFEKCRQHFHQMELIDCVTLYNELCSRVYAARGAGHDMPVVVAFLRDLHKHTVTAYQRRQIEQLSTGQLVRLVVSMSKLGVRSKSAYFRFAAPLHKRQLTGFEVVRLAQVLARHDLTLPLFAKQLAEQLQHLQQTLLPKQKVLLVKALGQLGIRWSELLHAVPLNAYTGSPPSISAQQQQHGDVWFVPQSDASRRRERQKLVAELQHRSSTVTAARSETSAVVASSSSFTDSCAICTWFFTGRDSKRDTNRSSVDDPLAAAHIIVGVVKMLDLHLCLPPVSNVSNAIPQVLLSSVEYLEASHKHSDSISAIRSPPICADLLVALATLHRVSSGASVSYSLLTQCARHLLLLSRKSQHPFADFDGLSCAWRDSIEPLSMCGESASGSHERSSLEAALRDLHVGVQEALLVPLRSIIAASEPEKRSTFAFRQMRMAAVFKLSPICDAAGSGSAKQHPQHLSHAEWIALLNTIDWKNLVAPAPQGSSSNSDDRPGGATHPKKDIARALRDAAEIYSATPRELAQDLINSLTTAVSLRAQCLTDVDRAAIRSSVLRLDASWTLPA